MRGGDDRIQATATGRPAREDPYLVDLPTRQSTGPPAGDMPRGPDGRPDFSRMTPEQLERAKEFMRARGLSDEQIAERIKQAKTSQNGESQ